MTPQSPTIAITPTGVPIKISSRRGLWTVILFCAITMGAVIRVPLYGYLYHYTWLDWSLFGLLYVVSGLGITVGYHRLMAHRSFDCPNWVKGVLLIGVPGHCKTPPSNGRPTICVITHTVARRKIRTMRNKGSGIATVDGSLPRPIHRSKICDARRE